MRSVALLSLAKSYSAIPQWRRISSHACCGMMPRLAWARASAASMSRYFWMRFSSAKMRRIGSVENMSRKIPELTPTAVILQPFGGQQHNQAPSLQNGRAAVYLRPLFDQVDLTGVIARLDQAIHMWTAAAPERPRAPTLAARAPQ